MAPTTGQPQEDPLVVFTHNEKTGGQTLRQVVRCEYRPEDVATIAGNHLGSKQLKAAVKGLDLSRLDVVQGHLPFGLDTLTDRPCVYITLVRDPVERLISLFFYKLAKRRTDAGASAVVVLEEFLRTGRLAGHDLGREIDNLQTRRFAGQHPPVGRCSPKLLDLAKANLEQHYVAVGTTERFEESLLVMKRRLGWRYVFFDKVNVTASRPRRDDLPASALRLIERRSPYDAAVHEHATALLDQAIAAEGPSFAKELESFRHLNAVFTELLPLPRGERRRLLEQLAAAEGISKADQLLLEANAALVIRDRESQQHASAFSKLESSNVRLTRNLRDANDETTRRERRLKRLNAENASLKRINSGLDRALRHSAGRLEAAIDELRPYLNGDVPTDETPGVSTTESRTDAAPAT